MQISLTANKTQHLLGTQMVRLKTTIQILADFLARIFTPTQLVFSTGVGSIRTYTRTRMHTCACCMYAGMCAHATTYMHKYVCQTECKWNGHELLILFARNERFLFYSLPFPFE